MCDDREKLIAYLYDEADAGERRQVEAHLAGCATCREELRGLRGVRQDLLAWEVPEHGSVWKPFMAPQVAAWWRQVPAWGFAAAATLVFGVGLAGVFAGRALAAGPVVSQAQVQPRAATPQAVAATPEQVRQLEERLASVERVALAKSGPASPNTVSLTRAELQQLLKESEGRINDRTGWKLVQMMVDLDKQRARDMASVTQQINDAQQQTNGNLVRVINARAADKEKE
jgi:anti-sigma factor RsiW